MPRALLTLGGLAALLLLAACVSTPRKAAEVPTTPWPERRAQLQSLDPFQLHGRVAVAAANEGFSAHLDWEQQGTRSALQLNGPLGVGGIKVVAVGDDLNVTTSRGEALDADAARTALSSKLGFDPPLTSLRYWVLGVPDPSHPSIETLGPDARLMTLEQDGWHILYSAYTSSPAGYSLPQKMSLQRGDVRVRLIVDNWQA
ncbi:MAG TPA: lipoprotein insertase outer membrane protein LolB [Steroidobacteraceae bacterium]|nr:lipoprotein insertase outer membrane protein LolB [Steroidobacteraceae bacterium]